MKTGSEQADPQRHTNWIPVHAEEQMGFDDTLKSTGRGPCHRHFYTTLPLQRHLFRRAPVPARLPTRCASVKAEPALPSPAPTQGLALSSASGKGARWTWHWRVKEPGGGYRVPVRHVA